MHEPVKSRLEDYLSGGGPFSDVEAHLGSCASCRREVDAMLAQSQLFDILRSPVREPEIRPDFYARVMGTIEVQQTRPSMWVLFGESLFARRLAYASAAFLMLLGTFLISSTTDPQQAVVASSPEVFLAGHSEDVPTPIDVQPSQRGVVLVNLASYNQDFQ